MDSPLIGFNDIEEIIRDSNGEVALSQAITSSFPGLDSRTARAFVNSIKNLNQEELCFIRTSKHDTTIPPKQSQRVTCGANTGPVGRSTPVLFEPDETSPWPNGLEVSETLLTVKKEKSSQVDIDITNNASHEIVLRGWTLLGRLRLVQSVTPVEVEMKGPDSSASDTQPKGVQVLGTTEPVQTVNERLGGVPMRIPLHIRDIDLEGRTPAEKEMALKLLTEEADSFAKDDNDVGCIPDLELDLDLEDQTPVQKNYVAVPKPLYPEVKAYIEDLLNRNFIKKSSSSYSSPVVCVRKKDQSLRLCVDFRALSKKTRPDRHPIPRIQEMLDTLIGNSWFSVLDQGKAYHQGFKSSNSQPLRAFITPWGFYEWVWIPFVFPRAWNTPTFYGELLGRLERLCVPYLDDIIIFTATFKDPIENIRKVFRRLKEHGVKLKPRKCKLFKREVTFLGRIVSEEGYKLNPSSVKPFLALRDSPPKTVSEVRRLTSFLNYYRRYVKNFSRTAKPIYDLVKTPSRFPQEVQRDKPTKDRSNNGQLPAKHPVDWTDINQSALRTLIDSITSATVMAYPDFQGPFVLHTDAPPRMA